MFVKLVLATAAALAATTLLAPSVQSAEDTIEVKAPPVETKAPKAKPHHAQHRRVAHARSHASADSADSRGVPTRGMSMAQVQHRFGAPIEKLPPAGGDTKRHPVINRWRYNGYTVYFERNRVIHSVIEDSAAASSADSTPAKS